MVSTKEPHRCLANFDDIPKNGYSKKEVPFFLVTPESRRRCDVNVFLSCNLCVGHSIVRVIPEDPDLIGRGISVRRGWLADGPKQPKRIQ